MWRLGVGMRKFQHYDSDRPSAAVFELIRTGRSIVLLTAEVIVDSLSEIRSLPSL